jgi:ABC superfamily ATP binding cassette transporter, permease/ABC protein
MLSKLKLGFGRTLPLILQNEAAECGLACLGMVCGFYGRRFDMLTLRQRFSTTLKGATLAHLIDMANRLQLSSRALRLDLHELRELRLPCVLHWNLNHFVVLKAVGKQHIVIHDPAAGVRKVGMAEVSRAFSGIALELWPMADFAEKDEAQPVPLKRLVGRLEGLLPAIGKILLLALCIEVFTLLSPLYMQWVLDQVVVSNDRDLLTTLAIGFALVAVLRVLTGSLRDYLLMYVSSLASVQWQSNIFAHLLLLPTAYFEKRHIGDVVSRFHSVETIQQTLSSSFFSTVLDGIMGIAVIAMMLLYSWQLSLLSFLLIFLYLLLRVFWYAPLRSATEEGIVHAATHDSNFLETIRGIKTIKLFNSQNQRMALWQSLLAEKINAGLRVSKLQLFYGLANGLLSRVGNILIIFLGAQMILDGRFSVGALMAFMSYQGMLDSRITQLINNYFTLKMLRIQTSRLGDIVVTQAEHTPEAIVEERKRQPMPLAVSHLRFRYSEYEPYVIDDVSFSVQAGESVAIIGASGCGKTTLLNLLLGNLAAESGDIMLDGKKCALEDIIAARNRMGIVMQDDVLFSGSINDNISFFATSPNQERIIASAKLAAIHDEIEVMPMGYNTLVGDMGTVFSGGQKQRILLARALYREPDMLFLDEATSHLDIAHENEVNQAIQRFSMTRIIIAHRLETILSADRVIVLERGKVAMDLSREAFLQMRTAP